MSYWSDRQEQLKKMAETDEEAIKKRLKKQYDKELRRLDREIAAYFQKYGEDNVIEYRQLMQQLDDADRTLLIEQMDEFAEKYPQYAHLMPVRESIYKLDRLQGLQYSVNIAQANIAGYTEEQIRQYETKLAQKGLNYSMETLGFGKNFYSINDNIVKTFVGVAWCNGENFSERIWNDTQKVANYINQDMAQAFARGDAYKRIAQDLQRRFGTNYTNAYRLVFTEGTYVMAESSIKPFEEDFEQYEYSPILDGKTCPICRALAGKVFLISERQPGVNFPPIHPWCRCSWEPYVENWDEWIDEYVAKHGGDAVTKARNVVKDVAGDETAKMLSPAGEAKTIEEAQEKAMRYVGSGYSRAFKNQVSYKGISLDNANEINRALDELYGKYNMPKINGIKVISPTSSQGKKVFSDADAVAAYSPVEQGIFLNKDILKSQKALVNHNNDADKAWSLVMDNIDNLTGSQKELALTYRNAGRQLVGDGSVHDYIVHEMGHHVEWNVLDAKVNNSMGSNMSKYAPHISGYANASKGEYIAESFAALVKGESGLLDPEFVDYMSKNVYTAGSRGIMNVGTESVRRGTGTLKTIRLPKDEYAHVMSELNTNMSARDRQKPIVSKAIGNYIYTIENHGFDDYRVIGKVPIDDDFTE